MNGFSGTPETAIEYTPAVRFILLLLGVASCVPSVEQRLPIQDGDQTVLLCLNQEDGQWLSTAIDVGQPFPLSMVSSDNLYAFVFREQRSALLFPDEWTRPPTERARAIPPIYRTSFVGSVDSWVERSPAEQDLPLVLPPFDTTRCVERGGCLENSDVCTVPCPVLDPPKSPEAPLLPTVLCTESLRDSPHVICKEVMPDRVPCGEDQVQFFGEDACHAVGDECPAGDWPTDIPAGGLIRYVDPSASTAGTGTSTSSPLNAIADALRIGSPVVVVVARGHLEGIVDINIDDVTLVGACASGTSIERLVVTGDNVLVKNLRVANMVINGRIDDRSGSLTIEGAIIEANQGIVSHTTLQVDRSLVGGTGILVQGGSASISEVVIDDVAVSGIVCLGGSLQVRDAVISGGDIGIVARCEVSIERVLLESNQKGFFLENPSASTSTLSDIVIRRSTGAGLQVTQNADVVINGLVVEEVQEDAILSSKRTVITAQDVVVVGAKNGFFIVEPTVLHVDRLLVKDVSERGGALISKTGSGLPQEHILSNVTLDISNGSTGQGLDIETPAQVNNVSMQGAFDRGITVLTNRDVRLEDIAISGACNAGIRATCGLGELQIERVQIEDICNGNSFGLQVDKFARAVLSDIVVEGATIGIDLEADSSTMLSRFSSSKNGEAGVRVMSGDVEVTDGRVENNPVGALIAAELDFGIVLRRVTYRETPEYFRRVE